MKILQYIAIYLAKFIIVLHAIVPHLHHHEVSNEKHAEIHQTSTENKSFSLNFIFHELTHDGQMEEVELSQSIDFTDPTVVFTVSYFNNFIFPVIKTDLLVRSRINTHFDKSIEGIQLSKGYSTSWGFRAPPVA
jgi:hypothetical protein